MIKEDRPAGFTIEIDTGGTFTDGYVSDDQGRVVAAKADTTPFDLTTGVLACIDQAATRLGMSRLDLLRDSIGVRLSTTIGTNTLINRNGPTIGLLLGADSQGVIDRLSESLPLHPDMIATVPEDGSASDAIQSAVRRLLESGARVLVITLSGGPGLADREQRVRRAVAAAYPRHYLGAVPVLPSHQVTPLDDERLRIQTAVLSAYLHPVMSAFLYRVEDALRADGFTRPLLIANADGGTSRVAKTTAVRTWGSGPAGGVAAAAKMASQLGLSRAIAYDVGGTSTDIAVVVDGQWESQIQPEIAGIEVLLPTLSIVSAPIGGGTIAHVVDGELRLGPRSAGAQPGPACFGLGGDEATVTDAVCHLGFLDPNHFLGGRKRLDPEAAERALRTLGAKLELEPDELANRITTLAGHTIAEAIRVSTGPFDAGSTVLFATGGGGGMLASSVHDALEARESFAFPVSPVFSAFGLSRLDVRHAYEVSTSSETFDADIDAVRDRAVADMRTEGFSRDDLHFEYTTEVVDDAAHAHVIDGVVSERGDAGTPRLTRLTVTSPTSRGGWPRAGSEPATPSTTRSAMWNGDHTGTPVYDWDELAEGSTIDGPGILETQETTLVVPPRFHVEIGSMGEARMMRR